MFTQILFETNSLVSAKITKYKNMKLMKEI